MPTVRLQNKKIIERFFRQNTELHIYSLGDLDDFFWPYIAWYGLVRKEEPEAVALLYSGQEPSTLLAFADHPQLMCELLQSVSHLLPDRFYAHLSPGVEKPFQDSHQLVSGGKHLKMALRDRSKIERQELSSVIQLAESDLKDLLQLYQDSYPENWFDRRMLETGQYFGIRQEGKLVSVSGVHVYSERYKVAALGNVTTLPICREKGYGTLVTARLCQSLSIKADHIGLNVKADNARAISMYKKLGFAQIAEYEEFTISKNNTV